MRVTLKYDFSSGTDEEEYEYVGEIDRECCLEWLVRNAGQHMFDYHEREVPNRVLPLTKLDARKFYSILYVIDMEEQLMDLISEDKDFCKRYFEDEAHEQFLSR